MMEEYRIFVENLSFPSFSKLLKAATHLNVSVRRTSRSDFVVQPRPVVESTSKKGPMAVTLKKSRGINTSSSKKPTYDRKEPRQYPILSPFPCGAKKAVALLEQWIIYGVVCLLEVECLPSLADQKDMRYCTYHRRKGHRLDTSRRILDEKHKAREILF